MYDLQIIHIGHGFKNQTILTFDQKSAALCNFLFGHRGHDLSCNQLTHEHQSQPVSHLFKHDALLIDPCLVLQTGSFLSVPPPTPPESPPLQFRVLTGLNSLKCNPVSGSGLSLASRSLFGSAS